MAIIHTIQSIQFPGLLTVMKAFTFLGSETFYLFVLPVLIWCWRQDIVRPLVVVVLLNFLLNLALKEAFALPRPPAYLFWTADSGYGFPSGHAQGAVVLFGYLGGR
jgi:glycerophosphoryl diester phosphodiesterase